MSYALICAGLSSALLASPQSPKTATIQMPPEHRVTGALMVDVDGDSHTDLVLACHHKSTGQRSLRVYLRQPKGPAFTSSPSQPPYEVDRDVVAFTFCDCNKAPGSELILLTPEQVVAAVASEDGPVSYTRLAKHQLIWPAADNQRVVPLNNAAIDIDQDGHTDLLLPRPDGWSVWFQDRLGSAPTFERHVERTLPPWQSSLDKAMRSNGVGTEPNAFRMRFGTGKRTGNSGPLVSTATRTPPCHPIDLDDNGMLDLVMHRNGTMYAAMQTKKGEMIDREARLPLSENRLKVLDPAFNLQWANVDQNGSLDLLITTSAERDGDVETRVDLFITQADGTWPSKPTTRLRMQTLARPPQIVDADGDGRDDLVCITLRTTSIPDLSGAKASSFDAQLNIYANDGTQFETPSLLSRPLPLVTNSRLSKPFVIVRPGRRGRPGDVVIHLDGHLERRFLNRKEGRLTLSTADARTPVPAKSRILITDPLGDEILIVTDREVRHVRFRR